MTKPAANQKETNENPQQPFSSSDEEPDSYDLFDNRPFDRYDMDFEPMEVD